MTLPPASVPVHVRVAVPGDAGALGRLEREAATGRGPAQGIGVAVAADAALAPVGRRGAEALGRLWEERLRLPAGDDHFALAADDGSGVVGYAVAGGSRDGDGKGHGELYALVVAPGRGVEAGEALGRVVVVRLNDAGYARVTCWVPTKELAAPSPPVTALARIGFSPDGDPGPSATPMRRLVRPLRRVPRA